MKTLYLIVEDKDTAGLEKANPLYRTMVIRGSTYTQEEYRKWAVNVLGAESNSSMAELAKACARGGGKTIQIKIY